MNGEFVYVDEHVSDIRWDAKYATWDNFVGRPVDGYQANRIVGTMALCEALTRASLAGASCGVGLLLWDGYRPQRAVDCFLRWSREKEDGVTKTRHYPNIARRDMIEQGYVSARSGHSRGSTVDLTLFRLDTGELLPMGGDHDLMDPVSHHDAPGVEPSHARNRATLRGLMEAAGFAAYDCEWWHYSLRDEPFPDDYFDVPITTTLEHLA